MRAEDGCLVQLGRLFRCGLRIRLYEAHGDITLRLLLQGWVQVGVMRWRWARPLPCRTHALTEIPDVSQERLYLRAVEPLARKSCAPELLVQEPFEALIAGD